MGFGVYAGGLGYIAFYLWMQSKDGKATTLKKLTLNGVPTKGRKKAPSFRGFLICGSGGWFFLNQA
jgi:hypothetical protein